MVLQILFEIDLHFFLVSNYGNKIVAVKIKGLGMKIQSKNCVETNECLINT